LCLMVVSESEMSYEKIDTGSEKDKEI
jgi:hypothetical protein